MALLRRKSDQVVQLQGVDETGTAIGDAFTPETISFTANPVQRSTVRRYVAGSNNYRKRVVYDTHYEFSGTVEANPQTVLAFIYWAVPCFTTVGAFSTVNETHQNEVAISEGYDELNLLNISVCEDGNTQTLEQCVFTSLSIEVSALSDNQTMLINFSGIAQSMASATSTIIYNPLKLKQATTYVLATPYTAKHLDTTIVIGGNSLDLLVTQFSLNFERAVNTHYVAGSQSHSGMRFIPEKPTTTCRFTATYTKTTYDAVKAVYDSNSAYLLSLALWHSNKNNTTQNYFSVFSYPKASSTELTPIADVATDGIREFSFAIENFDTPTPSSQAFFQTTSHSQSFPYEKNTAIND